MKGKGYTLQKFESATSRRDANRLSFGFFSFNSYFFHYITIMSTDPLSLLRESTISNKPVILLNEADETVTNISDAKTIQFNENTSFPRDAPTNFKKTNAADNETYTLETLIFLVENAQLDNSAYFKECRTRGIEHVSIVDRRKILDYLTGKVDHSPNVTLASTGGKSN
jgi:parafibromin